MSQPTPVNEDGEVMGLPPEPIQPDAPPPPPPAPPVVPVPPPLPVDTGGEE